MFCKVSVTEWEGSDGAAGNSPYQNQSIYKIRGETEESERFTSERMLGFNSFTKLVSLAMIPGHRNEQSILSHGKASQD